MDKFSLDFNGLDKRLSTKKAYLLADVKDKIVKVAFDVVRFREPLEGIDKLWKIVNEGDHEYIVAMYDDEIPDNVKTASNPWSAEVDVYGYVQIFHHNSPIKKIAVKELGIPVEDAGIVARSLPVKLAADERFRDSFLNSLTIAERRAFSASSNKA